MPELLEPAEVKRPKPHARWDVDHRFTVYRFLDNVAEVRIHSVSGTNSIQVNAEVAAKLGAAITAAAHWTPEPIVDAEIVDDRPRIDYQLLVDAVVRTRFPWMTRGAAEQWARDLAGWFRASGSVVIVRNGEELS